MNIEALTQDLNAALAKHGISGPVQCTISALIALAVSPGGAVLIKRGLAGATLFAVDDSGSVSYTHGSPSTNGYLLNQLLASIPPPQLRDLLVTVLAEIRSVRAQACNCPKCLARRAGTPSHKPSDKGALEAAFIHADATDCRSKH